MIGGFGEPDNGGRFRALRCAWVCVRWTTSGTIARIRAENVATEYGLYDVAEPGPDLRADFAEDLWRLYEGKLPQAISALEKGSFTRDNWLTILLHVQAQSIRHPDFARAVHEHLGPSAAAAVGPDGIQVERQRTFDDTRNWMARARFAVLRRSIPCRRFLANDKGYVPLHEVTSTHEEWCFRYRGSSQS
jgi:hypothetical protein